VAIATTPVLAQELRRLSLDLPTAVAELPLPVYVVDRFGVIRWLNAEAERVFGNRRGEHYSVLVAPEALSTVREQFARKIAGTSRATAYDAVLINVKGDRLQVDLDSVAAGTDAAPAQAVAVFGIAEIEQELDAWPQPQVHLTPRQLQVLQLLAGGCSTDRIAARLHLSRETVRNHIRHLLRALNAHSRLEAVAQARKLGIV
jgi:DNA-binding NarL/FixJ family response regulator